MSIHTECGRHIIWARRRDDNERFYPPLELVGMYFVIDSEGVGSEVPCFQIHTCNPADVSSWQERLRQLEIQMAAQPNVSPNLAYAEHRRERREEAWLEAMKIQCPKCEAPIGEYCRNLGKGSRNGEPTRWPHEERSNLN